MFRILFVILSCAFFLLTMTMANPCPCETIVNEPSTSMLEPTLDELLDKKFLENYFDRLPADISGESFPSNPPEKNFDLSAQRNKRPSWAAVGKRTISYINKRPSWAQVG